MSGEAVIDRAGPELQAVPAGHGISRRSQRLTLTALFLIGVFNYADRTVISVLLEPIKADFKVSDTELGLLTGFAFALLYATLGVPISRLVDRGDRPRKITIMLAFWSVMSMLSGMASSFFLLVLARIGVGAGEAGAIPAAQGLIGDVYPPEDRPRAIAIYTLAPTGGILLATLAGPWIESHYGWRIAFIAIAAPGLIFALFVRRMLSEPRSAQAMNEVPEPVFSAMKGLLVKRTYRIVTIAMTLYYFVAFGAFLFIPSFLVRTHSMSVAAAGAMFGVGNALGGVVGTYLLGELATRLARRDEAWLMRLPAICLVATFVSFVAFLMVSSSTALWVTLLLAGALTGGALPPLFSVIQLICGAGRRATAVALVFLFCNTIGLGLGPVIAGGASDFLAASHGAADGLRLALIAVTTLLLPSAALLWVGGSSLTRDNV